jgi:hypothetical protein
MPLLVIFDHVTDGAKAWQEKDKRQKEKDKSGRKEK